MIEVCLLGTGGMLPLPDRALTSLYLRLNGRALLIDCGEGTQTAIRAAGLRFKPIEAILITHFHADHISGLPGLLLTLGNEGRDEPLHIYGPHGLRRTVDALRVITPGLPYEILCHEMDASSHTPFPCIGLNVTAFPADHGMPCLSYHFYLPRAGKFDPERARAKGIPVSLWSRLQRGESVDGFTPNDVLGEPRPGIALLYATDTRPTPALQQYAQNADLLILEGMFGDPEKQSRAEEARHMMMQEAAQIARDSHAKFLWLTHFSPANREPEAHLDEIRAIFPNTIIPTNEITTLQPE